MTRTAETDRISKECWNRSFYAYATGTIFERRAQRYRWQLRCLSFTGLAVPLAIGGIVIALGTNFRYVSTLVAVATSLGVIQLILTLGSIVYDWNETFGYAQFSASDNFDISTKFRELASEAVTPGSNFAPRSEVLKSRDDARRVSDTMQGISEKEKRRGHRAALRQFQRACEGCKQVPTSMKASNCQICGGF